MKTKVILFCLLTVSSLQSIAQSTLTATLVNRKYGFGYPSLTRKDNMGYPLIESLVIPAIYEATTNMHFTAEYEDLVGVNLDLKWGYIDATGATKIAFKYEEASYFHEGLAPVKLNGKWGFINKTGATVIPFKYDDAGNFFDGLALVELGGKVGYITKAGSIAVAIKYDKQTDAAVKRCYHCGPLYAFTNGKTTVVLNGKCGVVDTRGAFTPCADEPLDTAVFTGIVNSKKLGIWVKGSCPTNQDIRSITLNDKEISSMSTNFDNQMMFQDLSMFKPGQKITLKIIHAKQCTYQLKGDQGFDLGAGQENMVIIETPRIQAGVDSTIITGRINKDFANMFIQSESKGRDDIKKIYLNDEDITAKCSGGARRIINLGVLKYKKGQKVTVKIIHKKGVVVKQLDPKVVE